MIIEAQYLSTLNVIRCYLYQLQCSNCGPCLFQTQEQLWAVRRFDDTGVFTLRVEVSLSHVC